MTYEYEYLYWNQAFAGKWDALAIELTKRGKEGWHVVNMTTKSFDVFILLERQVYVPAPMDAFV